MASITTKAAVPDRAALRARAEELLHQLAGERATLRDDQWIAVEALVADRRRALVVQKTGWGKSFVYWAATSLLREAGAGPTVVVSPLLALMRNQIAAATKAGIRAVTINSSNVEQWAESRQQIAAGTVDVLLVSPERLNSADFRDNVLPDLVRSCGLLVVDEAHCASTWGHDFRPDYRRVIEFVDRLPAGTPILATTATAPSHVITDISEMLGLGPSSPDVLVLRGPLDRESLYLSVVPVTGHAERLAWLSERLLTLPGSGIVYCLTVSGAEDLGDHLARQGHKALVYTGRTGDDERLVAEQALLEDEVKVICATSALGMGFDKPNLGFVVHFGAPSSPVAYYQQVGRAGRGVERAEVILMPGADDRSIWDYFASASFPTEEHVRAVLGELAGAGGTLSTPALEARVPLSRNRLELLLKVLDVDGAVRRVKGGWASTGTDWVYDAERYGRVAETRRAEHRAMLDYIATASCRMRFLREQLDDPAQDCGRCDNCTGNVAETTVGTTALAAAAERLARPGVVLDVRSMWPAAMQRLGVDLGGRIPESERPEPGRAVARFSDLGYGQLVRGAAGPGRPDAPGPQALLDAAVKVLSAWKVEWPERPVGIVAIGSSSRPQLVGSLAAHLAAVGKLPLLGTVAHLGPSAGERSNSAFRLKAVADAYSLGPELESALEASRHGRPLFLVDDLADTGWTIAVVARLLRRAGAGAVYPLVLGQVG